MPEPLQVTATLAGPIHLGRMPIALDALVMWAKAQVLGKEPPACAEDCEQLPIPIAESDCGRYHLASCASYEIEDYEHRWINRRFPVSEAQMLGNEKLRRIQLSGGPCKSYRIPMETTWLVDDVMRWWCIGEPGEIRDLLGWVGYLGKRRAVGMGQVASWSVDPCEPWGDGFPVVRGSMPLRPLPVDTPGVGDDALQAMAVLRPPYWAHYKEEPCVVPM
jgi:hypothetical protein